MKNFYKALSVFILISFLMNSVWSQKLDSIETISTQKARLRDQIEGQVQSRLLVVLKESKFIVNVSIETNEISVEDLLKEQEASKGEKKGGEPTGSPSEIEPTSASIRPEEGLKPEMSDDYVVFSKLGLVAPLVDDFNDFRPDGKILLTMDQGSPNLDKLKQQQVKDKVDSPADMLKKMWLIKNSQDVYQNLKRVNITVILDERLEQASKKLAESVVTGIDFNLGKIKPTIEIKYQYFQEFLKTGNKGIFNSTRDFLNFLAQMSTSLGMVFMAILIGFIVVFVLRKLDMMVKNYRDFSLAMQSRSENNGKEEKQSDDAGDSLNGANGQDGGNLDVGERGIDRFLNYLNSNPDRAILIIKTLLNELGTEADDALTAIVEQVENDTLSLIFKKLTHDERNVWKSRLKGSLSQVRRVSANAYVSSLVTSDIISDGIHSSDNELCDLLIALKPAEATEFIQNEKELAPYLLNFLSPAMLNRLFNNFSQECGDLIERGLQASVENKYDKIEQFKQSLKSYVSYYKVNPLAENLMSLLNTASQDMEKTIYEKLIAWGYGKQLKLRAIKSCPYFLLQQLSLKSHKVLLEGCSIDFKSKYLFTLGDSGQELIEAIAPSGSRARDMLELELERLESDKGFLSQLQENKAKLQVLYVEHARSVIENNDSIKNELEERFDEWRETIRHLEVKRSPKLAVVGE